MKKRAKQNNLSSVWEENVKFETWRLEVEGGRMSRRNSSQDGIIKISCQVVVLLQQSYLSSFPPERAGDTFLGIEQVPLVSGLRGETFTLYIRFQDHLQRNLVLFVLFMQRIDGYCFFTRLSQETLERNINEAFRIVQMPRLCFDLYFCI